MHSAPSVNYPVGRSRWVARALILTWVAGAAAAVFWRRQVDSNLGADDWRQWVLVAGLIVAALGVRAALRAQPVGQLRWDGQYWLLQDANERGAEHGLAQASVHFDIQSLMLIRLAPADSPVQWLWAERYRAPDRWRALRRALYSRALSPEPQADVAANRPAVQGPTHPDAIP